MTCLSLKHTSRLLLAALCLGVAPAAFASWAFMPLEKVVEQNAVIVVGKIEKIEVGKPTEGRVMDTAYITVSKILKNSLKDNPLAIGGKLPLVMPGKAGLRSSKDILYKLGQEGVWILEKRDGTYWATFPSDFQPLEKEKEIVAFIEGPRETIPTFEAWVKGGKKIPRDRLFVGGSPWFDESTGTRRSPEAVYQMLYGK